MSRAKKIARMTFRILPGLIGLLLVGFLICKDPILQAVAQRAVRAETGMEVVIGKLETSLGEGTMTLSGFQLINPPEFGGGVLRKVRLRRR